MSQDNGLAPLEAVKEYAFINHRAGNKQRKRIWELTLSECRSRAKIHESPGDDDNERILTLKLGKKVLDLTRIQPGCSRLKVPLNKVKSVKTHLLDAVAQGLFDSELLTAQQLLQPGSTTS
ncbi:hypothetical protein L2725_18420 [Shewanella corallii]|uniref:Uncharacterized protein n=1 Tax=Shewanella corallii TaxID=560080 RepID=A0ABT0NB93_9GAMM|nr:hypothetical protein [Shewanella corallii]MCL2915733.1 hypothetical protein [Shewanella corallii]